jgi:hypothetical protein
MRSLRFSFTSTCSSAASTANVSLSSLYLCEFESCLWRGVLDTTLCDKVCQWLATGRWFSPGILVSSINKTDRNDITEILLKVVLTPHSLKSETTKDHFRQVKVHLLKGLSLDSKILHRRRFYLLLTDEIFTFLTACK